MTNESPRTIPSPSGESYGFVLERDEPIDEIGARAAIYRHEKTGARLLSVVIDDENKVFGVTFRTPPTDSTGVAHIMEHSVLGGSEKYPLKEPFLELIKGSLKTFVNAMTYPDKTVYPVASTNDQDFYNLVDVYLDAVFHPLITPWHLAQEGWHHELSDVNAPLTYRGIVYNEMKGAYSSPDSLLYRYSQQTLFPDTPYRHDSGGDPRNIPDLTYGDFKAFHTQHYHPSNALFFFYGDDDPARRLHRLSVELEPFGRRDPLPVVPLQAAWNHHHRFTFPYGVDGASDSIRKTLMSMQWLLPEKTDPDLNLALGILGYALIGPQSSPLRKALTDSALGEDVIGGIGTGLRQITFSAGLKNISAEDVDKVEAVVLSTLEELAEHGVDPEMVEAALNITEFGLRENNTGGSPRGLGVMMRALSQWLYDGDPLQSIRYEAPLAAFKRHLYDDPSYLQILIRQHLLENQSRTTVVLSPDAEYDQRLKASEEARLAAARSQLSEAELLELIDATEELQQLQARQDPPELIEMLPSLTLSDLEPTNRIIPMAVKREDNFVSLHHDLNTNGILYLNLAWDLHRLPQELLPWADLLSVCLTQMGAEREDYVKLNQRILRSTGGIGASTFVAAIEHSPEAGAWFTVGGKSTVEHAPEMLDIMRDILLTVRLDDRERLRQILLRSKARFEASLVPGGSSIVDTRLRAGLSLSGWVAEQFDGIDNLNFLRRVIDSLESDFSAVYANLEAARSALATRSGMFADVTLDASSWSAVKPAFDAWVAQLPANQPPVHAWTPAAMAPDEGLTLPAQVNYVGQAARLTDVGYSYHGSLAVISNLIRTGWLWDKIRVQGGAYGASVSAGRHSGVISFVSYRDPNLLSTLDVYNSVPDYLAHLDLTEKELSRAIIGAISSFDPYMLPDAKGASSMRRYLVGDSDDRLQQIREEILGTTLDDVHKFADVLRAALEDSRVVVLGSSEAVAAADHERPNWLSVQKVL